MAKRRAVGMTMQEPDELREEVEQPEAPIPVLRPVEGKPRRPKLKAKAKPQPQPEPESTERTLPVFFGIIGIIGSLYLATQIPTVIEQRVSQLRTEAHAEVWKRAGSTSMSAGRAPEVSELRSASDNVTAEYQAKRVPQIERLWSAMYGLLITAAAGVVASYLVVIREGSAAAFIFVLIYVVPLGIWQDKVFALYPAGFGLAGLLSLLIVPRPRQVAEPDGSLPDNSP